MNNKIESKIGALALRMSSSPILAITGVAALQADLIAKRIELLHELVPRLTGGPVQSLHRNRVAGLE